MRAPIENTAKRAAGLAEKFEAARGERLDSRQAVVEVTL
jgi:hypothetical protein